MVLTFVLVKVALATAVDAAINGAGYLGRGIAAGTIMALLKAENRTRSVWGGRRCDGCGGRRSCVVGRDIAADDGRRGDSKDGDNNGRPGMDNRRGRGVSSWMFNGAV